MARILVHDYSGHSFQVQLSRQLARRGHEVLHLYSACFQTPRGDLAGRGTDPEGFSVRGVCLGESFDKYGLFRRRGQEIAFGGLVANEISRFAPDLVLSGNAPLDTQDLIQRAAKARGARFIFWLQDIYSEAIARLLPRRLPVLGHAVGAAYRRLEYRLLRASDHIIAISSDFADLLVPNGVPRDRISVVENWAPLDAIRPLKRDNAWAREHMRSNGLRVVYAGTLGLKHDPSLLLDVARRLEGTLFVYAEGPAAERLAAAALSEGLSNLVVRPWLDFADMPAMLGGADITLGMIEPEAGIFSVPSKVLTYLAAGKPILAAIPKSNLAGRIVMREGAGLVYAPEDREGLLLGLERLAGDAALRARMGQNGRRYAVSAFDIETITDRFEAVMRGM